MKNGEMTTYKTSCGGAAPQLLPTLYCAPKLKALATPNISGLGGVTSK